MDETLPHIVGNSAICIKGAVHDIQNINIAVSEWCPEQKIKYSLFFVLVASPAMRY